MITAQKTWYNDAGNKMISSVTVANADDAFGMAQHVFKKKDEAYCITMDQYGNGSFATRVMSKEKMIFKIQYSAA